MSVLPSALLACAVCFSMTAQNREAYGLTTVFMSAMPLIAIGGIGWWVLRRILKAEPDFFAERPSPVPVSAEAEAEPGPGLVVARD